MDKTGQIQQKGVEIVKVSYELVFLMAKHLKANTIALSLVMPAAKILVRRVIGEQVVAKLKSVFFINIVKRRIEEKSVDIAEQVIAGARTSNFGFALQLDESTNVNHCSRLLFLRPLYTK